MGEKKSFAFVPGVDRNSAATNTALDFDDEEAGLPQPDEDIDDASGEARRHVDTKLQTSLTSDGLQSRLLAFYRDARTMIEEQGVNVLYLAFGRLKWFEAEKTEAPREGSSALLGQYPRRSTLDSPRNRRMLGQGVIPQLLR